jgi:hypothetical protein
MSSKKRVHLQRLGIIHLPNTDLTYIRNPERNKIFLCPSTSWKLTSGILLYSLFIFSPSHLEGNADGNTIRARIYARGEVSFAKFLFLQVGLPNCWRTIFLVLQKLDGCQVDLPNCWSCSKGPFGRASPTASGAVLTEAPPKAKKTAPRRERPGFALFGAKKRCRSRKS